jgi:hypothetical protein
MRHKKSVNFEVQRSRNEHPVIMVKAVLEPTLPLPCVFEDRPAQRSTPCKPRAPSMGSSWVSCPRPPPGRSPRSRAALSRGGRPARLSGIWRMGGRSAGMLRGFAWREIVRGIRGGMQEMTGRGREDTVR